MNPDLDPVTILYSMFPYPATRSRGRPWRKRFANAVGEGERIGKALLEMDPSIACGRILDAGCGTGLKTLGLARALPGAMVTGLDMSASALEAARSLATEHAAANIEFARRPVCLPRPADATVFDAFVCDGVLHHLEDPAAGLRSVADWVRHSAPGWISLFGAYGRVQMSRVRKMVNVLAPRFIDFEGRLNAARQVIAATGICSKKHVRIFSDDSTLADAALNPREEHFDVVSATRFIESGGFETVSWPDGDRKWPELRSRLKAAGADIEGLEPTLSRMDRWRLVELWKAPAMLGFLVRRLEA